MPDFKNIKIPKQRKLVNPWNEFMAKTGQIFIT